MEFEQNFPRRLKLINVRWKNLLVKTTLWLVAEIWFNYLGIDNLSDYSEFIFERNVIGQFQGDSLGAGNSHLFTKLHSQYPFRNFLGRKAHILFSIPAIAILNES
jgi:hypothetical protein